MQFQIAIVNDQDGTRITQAFFRHLEESVLQGRIVSRKDPVAGTVRALVLRGSTGITVHKLRTVEREQVILPQEDARPARPECHSVRPAATATGEVPAGDEEGPSVLRASRHRARRTRSTTSPKRWKGTRPC